MEQLYPRNILERHYPILREQREKEEREEEEEEAYQSSAGGSAYFSPSEAALHQNEPLRGGSVGRTLNTIA